MGIDARQRRIGIAILLATLGMTAGLTAAGTTQLLGHALLPLDDEGRGLLASTTGAPAPGQLGAGTGGRHEKDPMPVLCRNIFDSQTSLCGDAPEVADNTDVGPGDEMPPPPIDPNAPPPPCDGSIRLVGSFYIPTHPDRSFAAIVDATGKAMLYREGQPVGQRAVEHIDYQVVILRQASNRCSLSMFAPLVAAAPPPPPQQVAVADPGAEDDGIPAADLDRGITKVSDTEYAVTRGLLNQVLANQGAIMRVARVIPHTENGQVVGLKLYGVRRGSLLSRIGLQNGDTLRTINGYSMASIDDGISAFANLRNADHLTVSVTRGGTPTNLNYSIR